MTPQRLAVRVTALVTPVLLGALAVPSGGLGRGHKFRDLHLYRQYGDALLAGHVPYRDFFVEYPPGAIPLFAGGSFFPGGWYDPVFKVAMALCCLGSIWCVVYVLGREGTPVWPAALFLALVPIALGPVSLNTYDAWPAFLTVAAVAALVSDRPRLAFVLLGAAAAAKLYAVLLVPVAVAWLWRERRAVTGPIVSFCAAAAVLVVPWFALSPGGVWHSVHSQVGRALHTESLGAGLLLAADRLGWYHAHVVKSAPAISRDLAGGLPDAFATVSAVLAVVAALLPAVVVWRRGGRLGTAFAASVAGFLAFTKVLSPQYVVWLIPLAPFGGVAACALLVAALVLAQTWYFHYHSLWAVGPQVWTLLARNLTLVVLYALLVITLATGQRTGRQAALGGTLPRPQSRP